MKNDGKHRLHLIADDLRCEWSPPIDLLERWIGEMVRRFESDLYVYYLTRHWG